MFIPISYPIKFVDYRITRGNYCFQLCFILKQVHFPKLFFTLIQIDLTQIKIFRGSASLSDPSKGIEIYNLQIYNSRLLVDMISLFQFIFIANGVILPELYFAVHNQPIKCSCSFLSLTKAPANMFSPKVSPHTSIGL